MCSQRLRERRRRGESRVSRRTAWFGSVSFALGMTACSGLLGLDSLRPRADDGTPGVDGSDADVNEAASGVSSPSERDASDTWTTLAPMRNARAYLAGHAVDGKGYVIGGIFDRFTASLALEVYEPLRDTWLMRAPSSRPWWGASIAVLGGKIFVFGGSSEGNTLATIAEVGTYDPASDEWSTAPAMPRPRTFMTAVVLENKAYVIGGFTGAAYSAEVGIYDPTTGDWTAGAPIPTPRDHLSSAASDGAAYVFGGTVATITPTAAVEKYDPITNAWTTRAPMPTPRYDATCAEVNGILYVIGGYKGGSGYAGLDEQVTTVEAYDPATDTWSRKADMPTPRAGLTSFVIEGKIFVAGGLYGLTPIDTLQVYTP